MLGFDYGIRPNFMIFGDLEFTNLIHEGKVLGVAYGVLPYFGLLIEPPLVSLMFDDIEKGKECFRHFKKWTEGSDNDGDAVALSFIETDDGGYTFCIYPEYEKLINRCLPNYMRDEVRHLSAGLISFPTSVEHRSEHYEKFKQRTKDRPFVFCLSDRYGKLFSDSAIIKRNISFYSEKNIPSNSPESANNAIKDKTRKEKDLPQKLEFDLPEAVFERRNRRIKTFFPIIIEKLNYVKNFYDAQKNLILKGFADWQILQAACNIVVSYRMCNEVHFKALPSNQGQFEILDYLLTHFENPANEFPPDKLFLIETLERQIQIDTKELLANFGLKHEDLDLEQEKLQEILKSKKLL